MPKIKRLYLFILQSFLPVFAMTSAICLFIFLMQFLWKYIEDLVGKGLDAHIIIELFSYAALTLIPPSLPLAILLASLITFGNLGERLELLAIKAAGISLLKAMLPLIILISSISIGIFFYQNDALPRFNVKFLTLYRSIKQASPELDIPEGSFYNGVRDYSIYVKKKNKETGMLYNVKIYDTSVSFDNMSVYVCDSAHMSVPDSKDHLQFVMYSGQQFSSFKEASIGANRPRNNKFVPYGRESFKTKTIIIPISTDFTRMEESSFEGTQVAKNISELKYTMDSLGRRVDSMNIADRKYIKSRINIGDVSQIQVEDSSYQHLQKTEKTKHILNFDSLVNTIDENKLISYYASTVSSIEMNKNRHLFESATKMDLQQRIRMHDIERHKKFSLAFACLIFFSIGAPLGAIIRKGGLGLPVVISVLLFIVYYIIDTMGYKFARDGVLYVWQGIWLSSTILLPLGVFLSYKAMNDSDLFNSEAYGKFFRKLLRIKTKVQTTTELEVINIEAQADLETLNADKGLVTSLRALDEDTLRDIVNNYQAHGYDLSVRQVVLSVLKEKGAKYIDSIKINRNIQAINESYDAYKYNARMALISYFATIAFVICSQILLNWLSPSAITDNIEAIMLALSFIPLAAFLIFLLTTLFVQSDFYNNLAKNGKARKTSITLILLLVVGSVFYPITYFYDRRRTERIMKEGF